MKQKNIIKNKVGEIWKDIPMVKEGYQASNLGRIKSTYRKIICKNGVVKHRKGVLLKPYLFKGYLRVNIGGYVYDIHQLIAMAFLGHIRQKSKIVINHKNGIRNDNRIENLEIVTARYNSQDGRLRSKNKTSKYVGVHFNKAYNKWRVSVMIKGEKIYISTEENEEFARYLYLKSVDNEDKYDGNRDNFRKLIKKD